MQCAATGITETANADSLAALQTYTLQYPDLLPKLMIPGNLHKFVEKPKEGILRTSSSPLSKPPSSIPHQLN
jgi:hypothetical protein